MRCAYRRIKRYKQASNFPSIPLISWFYFYRKHIYLTLFEGRTEMFVSVSQCTDTMHMPLYLYMFHGHGHGHGNLSCKAEKLLVTVKTWIPFSWTKVFNLVLIYHRLYSFQSSGFIPAACHVKIKFQWTALLSELHEYIQSIPFMKKSPIKILYKN